MKKLIDYFTTRIALLYAFTKYSIQIETAYFFNNWSNLFSTTAFTLTYILFIDVVFSNTKSLAGYSKDEMLLFTLVSQGWFYTIYNFSLVNIENLIEKVNTGNLDTLLTKPLPISFFINFSELRVVQSLRDGLIPLIFIALSINWSNIHTNNEDLVTGTIILIIGTMISNVGLFISALPVFWIGESSSILGTTLEVEYNTGHTLPLEAYGKNLRAVFISVIPFAISTGLTTSVLLNRYDGKLGIIVSLGALMCMMLLRYFLWNLALRNYTSASS